MTTNEQAIASMASLVKIVAKHLGISQAALIDGVAHRLFSDPGQVAGFDPVAGLIIDDGLLVSAMTKAIRSNRCAAHNVVFADGEACGICEDFRTENGTAETVNRMLGRQAVVEETPNGPMYPVENDGPSRPDLIATPPAPIPVAGTCRMCGCTDTDCSDCIRLTGVACHWIEPDLCSACNSLTAP